MQSRHNNHNFLIYSDCQSTLRALASPRRQTGQRLLVETIKAVQSLEEMGHHVSFHWVPGHSGVLGNEAAHRQAMEATREGIVPPEGDISRAAFPEDRAKTTQKWRELLTKTTTGQFTKLIDKALPQGHTRRLYDKLSQKEAAILAQLRTGRCRLNGYLAKINASPSELCSCGQPETVKHFLFECPKWMQERQQLKQKADMRWMDLSYLLGGWSGKELPNGQYLDGPRDKWKPNLEVVMATIAFAQETRRLESEISPLAI